MALQSDAVMALFYDIAGDTAEHDDWHTYEHIHERLVVPGFLRATRWTATEGKPRYMAIYELASLAVGTSPAYLQVLNQPTPWTSSMMNRFRGMVRGFCSVAASGGYGIGNAALAARFMPEPEKDDQVVAALSRLVADLALRPGMAGVQLFRPSAPPPMTKEQSIRGPDTPMPWLLVATAHAAEALQRAGELRPEALARLGASHLEIGRYALHFTATAAEASRTPPNPPRQPGSR